MKNKFKLESLKQFIDLTDIDEKAEVIRKQFTSSINIKDGEARTFIASVTTTDLDHEGDIIIPEGINLSVFNKNPVIQWAHNYSLPPIGKAKEILIEKDCILMKIEMAETALASECWELIRGGYLKACSIGFIIKKAIIRGSKEFDSYITEKSMKISKDCNRIITEYTLLENSLCPVPCNPLALIQAVSSKSLTLSDKTITELELDKFIGEKDEKTEEAIKAEEIKEVAEVKEVAELKEEVKELPVIAVVEDKNVVVPVVNVPVVEAKSDIPPVIEQNAPLKVENKVIPEQVPIVEDKAVKPVFTIIRVGGVNILEEVKKIRMLKKGKIV